MCRIDNGWIPTPWVREEGKGDLILAGVFLVYLQMLLKGQMRTQVWV